jgi:hypothetical protein
MRLKIAVSAVRLRPWAPFSKSFHFEIDQERRFARQLSGLGDIHGGGSRIQRGQPAKSRNFLLDSRLIRADDRPVE